MLVLLLAFSPILAAFYRLSREEKVINQLSWLFQFLCYNERVCMQGHREENQRRGCNYKHQTVGSTVLIPQ